MADKHVWDNNGLKENPLKGDIRRAYKKDGKCAMCDHCGWKDRPEIYEQCDPKFCNGPEHIGPCVRCGVTKSINGCNYCERCWQVLPLYNRIDKFAHRGESRAKYGFAHFEDDQKFYIDNEHYLPEEVLNEGRRVENGTKDAKSDDKN